MRLTVICLGGPIAGAAICCAVPATARRDGFFSVPPPMGQAAMPYRMPLPNHAVRRHGLAAEWDGSALYLSLDHRRVGSKANDQRLAADGPWIRRNDLKGRYEYELSPDLSVSLGGEVAYTRTGSAIGPLLTRRTTTLSHELGLALSSPSVELSVSHFRLGGWERAPIGELANRMANGESMARHGMALELQRKGTGERGLRLRFEHSATGNPAWDSRALISWAAHY